MPNKICNAAVECNRFQFDDIQLESSYLKVNCNVVSNDVWRKKALSMIHQFQIFCGIDETVMFIFSIDASKRKRYVIKLKSIKCEIPFAWLWLLCHVKQTNKQKIHFLYISYKMTSCCVFFHRPMDFSHHSLAQLLLSSSFIMCG